MTAEPSSRNPYPGPRPFERGEHNLFFGRDREVADLLSLMIAHREVLLYAQSGAGKTSLLNAGVMPSLIQEGFEVLPVARVRGLIPEAIDPRALLNVYVFNTLVGWEVNGVDPLSLTTTSIPAFLRERGHSTDEQGLPLPSVAIFDQFEELFAFYPERWREREGFFLQVAEALETDPLLRVLFIIREDYLAHLDPYSGLLPEGLRTRFRLERLRSDAACLAVERPLRGTGRAFAAGVASTLVQELVGIRVESTAGEAVEAAGEYVEPVQLQVVCQNLWLELPPEATLITTDHLRTFGDVDEALKAFYERAVQRVVEETTVTEGELRSWFDQQLITAAGTRGTVYRGLERTGGIPNAAVDAMENQHLIRAELRAGGRWYELTHDRFIDPIQKSNEAWRLHERTEAQQRQIEAARQRAEEQERRAEEQRREARRLRRLSTTLVVVSLLAVGAAGVAVWGWKVADAERGRAEHHASLAATRLAEADKARAEAIDAQKMAEAERGRAEQTARLATARELAAAAIENVNRDPERSVLLAMQAVSETYAVDQTVTPEAEEALHRAVQAARVQLMLSGHTDRVLIVAFSPDGTRLATASADRTVKLWDAATGQELHTLVGHAQVVFGVAFSPDGTRLATASADETVKVWDAGSGELLRTLSDHTAGVWGVAFSPDGTQLATTSFDQTAKVWNVATGEVLRTLSGHTEAVLGVAFSPDGTHLATTSADSTAKVWDVASGEELRTLWDHVGEVDDVAFSPDGTRVATAASVERTVKVWDANSGQKLLTLSGHDNAVIRIAFSPDGMRLATASADGTARVWDATTGKELLTLGHPDKVWGIAYSSDGTRLATASWDQTARVWDVTPGKEVFTRSGVTGPRGSMAFSPKGTHLAITSHFSPAKVWDVATGQEVLTLFGAHNAPVSAVAFSPEGTQLATGSSDQTVKIWDAITGQEVRTLAGHSDVVYFIAFSPDGSRLATANLDHTARVWDVATGEVLFTLSGHKDFVYMAAFSPDGARLATAGGDGTVMVWDTTTGQAMFKLSDHRAGVMGIAYSPDGKRLASASQDRTTKVWDAFTGRALVTLSGHSDGVQSVAFSPDGMRLATVSADRTAKMWDAATGKVLLTLSGHTDIVTGVAFSADGALLATRSIDGIARVYALKIDDLMALARRRISRSLTSEECQRYLHQDHCPPTVMALGASVEGNRRARSGDMDGTVASLRRAQQLDPQLSFDPEAEASALTVAGLIATGKGRARVGDVGGATVSLQRARELNPAMTLNPQAAAVRWAASALIERGGRLIEQGKVKEALASYDAARAVDPELRISAGSWDHLCWRGSLRGYAAAVIAACEQAVKLVLEEGSFRISRGLARALMGDYAGAIEDFKFHVEWSRKSVLLETFGPKRQAWVAELEAGRNPFDSATLEALRLSGGPPVAGE